MREEAQRADPVIERHDDRALIRQRLAAVERQRGRADRPAAAIDEDHDRPLLARPRRRPDIEIEAILARRLLAKIENRILGAQRLQAHRRIAVGDEIALPGDDRLRRLPAQLAHGRGGKRNALVARKLARTDADNCAAFDLDPRRRIGEGGARKGQRRKGKRPQRRAEHCEMRQGHRFLPFARSMAYPIAADSAEPASTPSWTRGSRSTPSKARVPMNKLMVKPMPPHTLTP